ncbi:putative 2-aminoethylphosphonate ABC transporter substrate-binding protein [Paracraurococcus lichenis]|uniref:2-aminoethylphosphonate ABC transporter substrate-binding protein n=1 Tax=Paracraurococcus lichenis TaxID=3064888 RepID=A0ABT9EAX8_9PROT|nr:putative 2-aminoethylphosphonate ABC transporter substrate-binding protein [Paracraurococcus sp. LOR1-02]MDO9713292.1 putative 2-aminoethylphosphonate ABC transporter substrate-binding protein [Paracraurococcus sp. LOR1-02]
MGLALAAPPADAQTRTRLTVYTALENEQLQPFKQAAEAAVPGIEIAWVRDSTGVITARLIAERANPRADVVWGLSVFSLLQMEQQEMLEPYTPRDAEALRPAMRSDRSPMTWTSMDAFVSAICLNTVVAQQKGLPKPTTWADLLDPRFKGQIAMPNPASSGTGFLTVAGWITAKGEAAAWDYMAKLHENVQVYTHSGSAPCNNAARGEYGVGISLDMRAVTLKNQGAPVEIIVPTDGVGFDLEGTAILRGTRNADAARKLADFAVSRPAMELYGRSYAVLALPGVTPAVKGYPAEFEQRLVAQDFREVALKRDEILKAWAARFDGKSAPRN